MDDDAEENGDAGEADEAAADEGLNALALTNSSHCPAVTSSIIKVDQSLFSGGKRTWSGMRLSHSVATASDMEGRSEIS